MNTKCIIKTNDGKSWNESESDIYGELSRVALPDARLAQAIVDFRRVKEPELRGKIRTRIDELVVVDGSAAGDERLIVDFDRHGSENAGTDFERLRAVLERLPWTVAVFTSAGGNGLKWIVHRDEDLEIPVVIARLEQWLASVGLPVEADHNYKVACCRTSLSVDPKIFINKNPRAFDGKNWFERHSVDDNGKKQTELFVRFEDLMVIFSGALERIYSVGTGGYVEWVKHQHDFADRSETQVWRNLFTAHFPKMLKDRVLQRIAQQNYLSRVEHAHSGYNEGIFTMRGKRVAVASSPKWIAGTADGDGCGNVLRLLKSRFDDPEDSRQLPMFFAWLKRARERVRTHLESNDRGETPPEIYCPMLAIMGEQALGKTMIYKKIILPLLGGRDFDATKVLAMGDRFNAGVAGAEVMVIDDISIKDVAKEGRAHFAQEIKRYLYGGQVSVEDKFEKSLMLDNHAIVAVQLFNPEAIASTPDYSQAKDKVIFLNCSQFGRIEEDDASSDAAWAAANREIERELPAFAAMIDAYELPEDIRPESRSELRNGMIHYCARAVDDLLCENDRALILLQQYDQRAVAVNGTNPYTQKNWYGCKLPAKEIAERAEIKTSPEQAGQWLRELAKRTDIDGRVVPVRDKTRVRGWIIKPPAVPAIAALDDDDDF